ncbi:hypothetical protein [Ascidiimonas sp. W6]|uniref:hypothetical protein n=1 Tax=Ascidiimonas meishanensis TaxID=3128903 RepID=UPI0030EDBB69
MPIDMVNYIPEIDIKKEQKKLEAKENGRRFYQLSNEQVESPKFGPHTLEAIDFLTTYDKAEDNQEAFGMVQDLNATQVEGLRFYNLELDQVQTPNFGKHTLEAMNYLIFMEDMGENNPEVFEKVSGLNEIQTKGVIEYELTKDQVTAPNFGAHTLEKIDTLLSNDLAEDFQEAFSLIEIGGIASDQTEQNLTESKSSTDKTQDDLADKDPKSKIKHPSEDQKVVQQSIIELTKATLDTFTKPLNLEEFDSKKLHAAMKPLASGALSKKNDDGKTIIKKGRPKPPPSKQVKDAKGPIKNKSRKNPKI